MEKYEGNLNRYLRDGSMERARRYLERLCQNEETGEDTGGNPEDRFWELIPLCYKVSVEILGEEEGGQDENPEMQIWKELFDSDILQNIWLDQYLEVFARNPAKEEGDALKNIVDWMRSSFAGDVSLQSAARRMGMDPAYFSRYFKKQMGKNYSDMLTQIRLEHCEMLLRERADYSIEELTFACGFSSKSYFCEVFKKWKGMTVSQYVKQM